ncbi:hypothetical protein OIU77_012141 [Salix suchowensis]|uniref:Thiaminase-2/PQQC domain-containing protein n=1 Tax=Salix suchowensis TaxID=1278906 RepID=A0ABQ9A3S7_9ROSI|nr:hypothetical protein OIU77_012141 [Salix suchowensis]
MVPVKKSGMIDRWVKKHLVLYTGAISHPFILSIRDGTVDFSSFKRWLVRTLFYQEILEQEFSLIVLIESKDWQNQFVLLIVE